MTGKPNAVLLTSINNNAHSEESLRKQRVMVVGWLKRSVLLMKQRKRLLTRPTKPKLTMLPLPY
ncbi:hypothetical protein [Yersinia proxima]|uniref:hypothetical protein n=1 Tax=Yersinia proxima TaxID=2890316 RepID=UPI003D69CDB3